MLRQAHFTRMHSGGCAAGVIDADTTHPKQIYAHNAIPGEEAEVEILRRQRGFRMGVVHRLLKTSPDRVTPFCPHAQVCGGCNWQHISYPKQLYWKREILVNALSKYNIITPPVPEVVPSPLLQGYRNKSEYAFAAGEMPLFGFHPKEDSATVFPCETCFLQAPHVHPIAQKLFDMAMELHIPLYHYPTRTGLLKTLQIRTSTLGDTIAIVGFWDDPAIREQAYLIHSLLSTAFQKIPQVHGWFYFMAKPKEKRCAFYPHYIHFGGAETLMETLSNSKYRVSPASFFQPNPLQAQAICRQVVQYAQLSGVETIYDLYTGVGTLAFQMASGAKWVMGIEGNPAAVLDAQHNAIINHIDNVQFLTGDVLETFTPEFIDNHPKAHLIILDPPRSGTLTEIKKTILYAAPQKIIYVSCNPVSLAWDLKQLCEGGYCVTAIQPFDMFPHTQGGEVVCLLEDSKTVR